MVSWFVTARRLADKATVRTYQLHAVLADLLAAFRVNCHLVDWIPVFAVNAA